MNFYPFVSQYDPLFSEASGLFISSLPWLRNKKGAKKNILLYASEARQLVDFQQLQLLNKWHPSIILFLSGSHWWGLTLSRRRPLSYRNQSIDLRSILSWVSIFFHRYQARRAIMLKLNKNDSFLKILSHFGLFSLYFEHFRTWITLNSREIVKVLYLGSCTIIFISMMEFSKQ